MKKRPPRLPLRTALVLLGAVALAGCGGSNSGGLPATYRVDMTNMTYNPAVVTVNRGDTLVWANLDQVYHTVTADATNADPNGPYSGTALPSGIRPGGQVSFTVPPNTPHGTVWYYHCGFHGSAGNGHSVGSGMAGTIIVN